MVFGSLVAFTAYVWLLRVASLATVSTYAYVNPVVAVVLPMLGKCMNTLAGAMLARAEARGAPRTGFQVRKRRATTARGKSAPAQAETLGEAPSPAARGVAPSRRPGSPGRRRRRSLRIGSDLAPPRGPYIFLASVGWAIAGEPLTRRTLLAASVIVTAVALIITNQSRVARVRTLERRAPRRSGSGPSV